MNQSKNPEYQAGRVDIAVEQCDRIEVEIIAKRKLLLCNPKNHRQTEHLICGQKANLLSTQNSLKKTLRWKFRDVGKSNFTRMVSLRCWPAWKSFFSLEPNSPICMEILIYMMLDLAISHF